MWTAVAAAAFAATIAASPAFAEPTHGYVIADASERYGVRFKKGPAPNDAIAWAVYDEEPYHSTGWASLDLHANPAEQNDTLTAYAAGFVEGALTSGFMHSFVINSGCNKPNAPALQQWLDDNWAWMKSQVAAEGPSDPYWAHLGTLLAQIEGLVDGQAAVGGTLSLQAVYNEIIGGDMHQLAALYGETSGGAAPPLKKPTGHCSALIRLLPGADDLYVAHATWTSLYNMMRILKRYDLPFPGIGRGVPVPGRHSALSGYPAQMGYSSDDFYVLSSGLVTLETSLSNNNMTRAHEFGAGATHEVVLEWARNMLANRLATDGASWGALFARYASGTYCNSWMIVDTNLFKIGDATLKPGTLTVVEEMPGLVTVHDQTAVLSATGYWGSYNVPSDPEVYNASGAWALVDEYGGPEGAGAYYTFANTSRARIFDRDAPGVTDEAGLRRVIRYNDYKHDPLSRQGCGANPPYAPTNAIADRSDLAQPDGDYIIPDLRFGPSAGIDAKYTAASWLAAADVAAGALPLAAQSGPTYDQQPPLDWETSAARDLAPHAGQPRLWRFPWVRQPWAV